MSALVCPECSAVVAPGGDWVTWCEACGWNAAAPTQPPAGAIDRFLDRAGQVLGDRLLAELKRNPARLEPGATAAKAAAYGIALLVHALSLGLLAGAVTVVVLTFPNVFAIAGAALAVAFAWLIRPRFSSLPDTEVIHRDEAPELFALVDCVVDALGTQAPDLVVLDGTVNAYWGTVGMRRRRVLGLGVPLLVALTPQARVALIAHEAGHERNGDLARGFIVGSALGTLTELYRLLTPGRSLLSYSTLGFFDYASRGLLLLLAQPIKALLLLEYQLLFRDLQRAEYLADHLAASVAGTEATVALHEALLLSSVIELAVQHAGRDRRAPEDVMTEIGAALAAVPERERRRRRRAAALQRAKLAATHPPTASRIELLEASPQASPRVALDDAGSRAIDAELAPRLAQIGRRLLDAQRAALYH